MVDEFVATESRPGQRVNSANSQADRVPAANLFSQYIVAPSIETRPVAFAGILRVGFFGVRILELRRVVRLTKPQNCRQP
jgi:hypothetical protein